MYVRNLSGDEFPLQATSTNDGELNGNQSFSCKILPTKVNASFIGDIAEMWEVVDHDVVTHKIIYVIRRGEGDKMSVEIKAEPLFFDVFNTARIYEEYDEHMTAMSAFTKIFADMHPFSFVLVDQFDAVEWEGFGAGETRLKTFQRALDRYKMEFRISGNIVYLERQIGRDTQFMYRHKLNASNVVQEIDANEFYTYAKGYGDYGDGDGGEDWKDAKMVREYTSPLAKIPSIGIRHAPPIKNGNILVASAMDAGLKAVVDGSLKISISASIHDLRRQGYALAQPERGDRVFIIDERIGLNEEVRVVDVSVTKDWRGNVIDFKVKFGDDGLSKRHQASINTAADRINDLIDGKTKLPFSAYDQAVQNATKAIQGITSELTVPPNGGLMAVDEDDPNNVVLFNAAGVGISNNGGATFKNSITGEGVIAETIIGQSIIGVNLSSVDEMGYFHVSGSDAEFYDASNNRRVNISPDGIYGHNAGGDVRFQADSTLVTSSAFGTSNANVYLAARGNNEARVVDYADIPGDGAAASYRYLPMRASGFYGNFINVNTAHTPDGLPVSNIYARPLSDGEFRVTLNGSTTIYQPIRAESVKANIFEVNSLSGSSNHLYLRARTLGEIRATVSGTIDNYIPVRGSGFYGSFIDRGTDAGVHLYARPAGGGSLKVTVRGTTESYLPVQASAYLTPNNAPTIQGMFSLLSAMPEENEATEIISNLDLIRYTPEGVPEFKIINDSAVSSNDGLATDISKTLMYVAKSVQEINRRLKSLEGVS